MRCWPSSELPTRSSGTRIILWITDRTIGLRVTPREEEAGLDFGEHAEVAYQPAEAHPT
jgi:ammonia channel protein AmtB